MPKVEVIEDFGGTNDRVHHTNYFRQTETLKAIPRALTAA
jgi:hypothetical protein